MRRFFPLLCLLMLALAGCGKDLHFKISYGEVGNLSKGDPVVLDEQQIGEVTRVEKTEGGHLVEVAIPLQSAGVATSEAAFLLDTAPDNPQNNRIEIVLAGPGGKPIAEGAIVRGSYPNPLGLLPFGEIFRSFGSVLKDLSGQVERFRQEFGQLPNSPEARRLQAEWRKLADEIAKAQNQAGDSLKHEILPKLEKEMENLRKQLEELQKNLPKKGQPLET